LDIAGATVEDQPPLDGVSLLPLIDGKMKERERPMGFWDYPEKGIGTPSHQWMTELLAAQEAGREPEDTWKLRLDAGEIKKRYSKTELPGHSALIDGDWKLHRIADATGSKVKYELYNLREDRAEENDVIANESDRTERMKAALGAWQRSVVGSLNGEDY
jgi:hypothetical protein